MLLPRFSIGWTLLLTTVLGSLFVVVRQAFLGQQWAMAVSAVLALGLVVFLVYGAAFLSAYGLARLTRTLNPHKETKNPFVIEGEYPPQMVPKNPYGDDL